MNQLLIIKILHKSSRRNRTSSRKLIEFTLSGCSDEHDTFDWKFTTVVESDLLQLFLIIRLIEVNQSIEIFEITMIIDVVNLIDNLRNIMILITKILNLIKEILTQIMFI